MKRLAFTICLAVTFIAATTSVRADWRIIQWSYGDCKIWFDKGIPPFGGGWRALSGRIPDYGTAYYVLQGFYNRRICR